MKFREAKQSDLLAIVAMIADDKLGSQRENFQDPLPQEYVDAFRAIDSDPNQELIVVESEDEELMGCFQLSFIRYLTYQGGIRAQVEGVRVKKEYRGAGTGKIMIGWAIQRAKQRNAHLLQLTTDKQRPEAIKFYKGLGFVASHEGMKLHFR